MSECIGVEEVLDHLMFHKAMIDEGDRAEKIDRYLCILTEHNREQIFPHDPLEGSIHLVFDLVMNNNFDPWDVDLVKFSEMYARKMQDEEINFIIAGKLMLMAWSILRMQSEEVLSEHQDRYELFCADWDMDNLDMLCPESDIPRLNLTLPDEIELEEVVRHRGSRPVSLIELLDAFDEARDEAEIHLQRQREREARKAALDKFDTKAHAEDMEKDVDEVWQRILTCGSGAISIEDLCNGDREDTIKVFVSLLFLARAGKITLWQEDLPFGQIFLEVKMAWDIGMLEDVGPMKAEVGDRAVM